MFAKRNENINYVVNIANIYMRFANTEIIKNKGGAQ